MKFKFVVATQKPKGTRLPIHDFLDRVKHDDIDVELDIHWGNHDGLSNVYNDALNNSRDREFLILIHDDITINDHQFFAKVINSEFDVMGPVGGCHWGVPPGFDVEHKPLIWTVATCGKGASGFMNHDLTSSGHSGIYSPSSYGPSPLPTASLDGCCLILNKHAVERGLRFDCEFDRFDFYDHALVQSALRLGLKVGTVPILCTHGSVGAGVLSHPEEYLKYQKLFIDKYLQKKVEKSF